MRCASRETSSSRRIALRRDLAHARLDPGLHLVVDREHVAPRGLDQRADDYRYSAGALLEGVARPVLARVVGDRQEQRAADAVAPHLARRGARALGEDRDPHALPQALPALLHDLLARARAGRAV